MEGFLQKTKSGYHIFTEKCPKNNKKVKGHVYAFPVPGSLYMEVENKLRPVKLVQQLQIVFRLVLCIAHRCDCNINKRNKDPVCTYCIRCKHMNEGGTVAQWLALLPHSKKVLGSFPAQPGPFCVEFACSPRVCVGFLRVLRFPPTSKDMHRQC